MVNVLTGRASLCTTVLAFSSGISKRFLGRSYRLTAITISLLLSDSTPTGSCQTTFGPTSRHFQKAHNKSRWCSISNGRSSSSLPQQAIAALHLAYIRLDCL